MKHKRRVALAIALSLIATLAAYAGWTHVRSPESAADDNSYGLSMALLKGFEGDVRYLGSDATHGYFRVGRVFWSTYKIPVCAFHVPEVFSVGSGTPYVVHQHVGPNNMISIGDGCRDNVTNELGNLDRSERK
jgi:hypothetical protein